MAFGRRAIQSNIIALFMLQQRKTSEQFSFRFATCRPVRGTVRLFIFE